MQATIYANRLSRFRSKLAAGTMFTISGFDVTRCAQNFRLTDSPLMIRFNDSTAFDELTKPVSPLPEEGFRFRDHSELIGLANTNAHLPGWVRLIGLFINYLISVWFVNINERLTIWSTDICLGLA